MSESVGKGLRREAWSEEEVRLAVEDYFDMLRSELHGESFNKSEHRAKLRLRLNERSDGSVEMKHMNISAALDDMGFPSIDGYKPLPNYQGIVLDMVEVLFPADLRQLVERTLEVVPPRVRALEMADPTREVRPPEYDKGERVEDRADLRQPALRFDYAARDASNRRLGELGEEFVLEIERKRLLTAGRHDLARAVQWTAKEVGDGLGYDIRSFTKDGEDVFVEVKTTNLDRRSQFFVTSGEVKTSEQREAQYRLVRVFQFSSDARFYTLAGAVSKTCVLSPKLFRARPG